MMLRCKMKMKKWQKALIVFLIYYMLLFIGAIIIMYIEAKGLKDIDDDLGNYTEPVRRLLNVDANITFDDKKINEIIKLSYDIYSKSKKMKQHRWKRRISWDTLYKWRYFTHITITTVGFGDVVPETDGGKIFVIIYGLIGIPVNVLLIALIGGLMSESHSRLIRLTERYVFNIKESKNLEQKTVLLLTVICILWLVVGAAVARSMMGWKLIDGFYYAFVKCSTIGYGDLLMNFDNYRELAELISWYTIIGLAAVTGLLNAVNEPLQTDPVRIEPVQIEPEQDKEREEKVEDQGSIEMNAVAM